MLKLCALLLLPFFLRGSEGRVEECTCNAEKDLQNGITANLPLISNLKAFVIKTLLNLLQLNIKDLKLKAGHLVKQEGTENTYLLDAELYLVVSSILTGDVVFGLKLAIPLKGGISDGCHKWTYDILDLKLAVTLQSNIINLGLDLKIVLNAIKGQLLGALKYIISKAVDGCNKRAAAYTDNYQVGDKVGKQEVTTINYGDKNIASEITTTVGDEKCDWENVAAPPRKDNERAVIVIPANVLNFLLEQVISLAIKKELSSELVQTLNIGVGAGLKALLQITHKSPAKCNTDTENHHLTVDLSAAITVGDAVKGVLDISISVPVQPTTDSVLAGLKVAGSVTVNITPIPSTNNCGCANAHEVLKPLITAAVQEALKVVEKTLANLAKVALPVASGTKASCTSAPKCIRCTHI